MANFMERRGASLRRLSCLVFDVRSDSSAEIAAASAAAEATAASTGTGFLWFGFVHGQGSAVHLRSVQGSNGSLGFFRRGHFNKAEASGLSRKLICNHARRFDRAVRGKQAW